MWISSDLTSFLQCGQLFTSLAWNHLLMHLVWNKCPHGVVETSELGKKHSRQVEHEMLLMTKLLTAEFSFCDYIVSSYLFIISWNLALHFGIPSLHKNCMTHTYYKMWLCLLTYIPWTHKGRKVARFCYGNVTFTYLEVGP